MYTELIDSIKRNFPADILTNYLNPLNSGLDKIVTAIEENYEFYKCIRSEETNGICTILFNPRTSKFNIVKLENKLMFEFSFIFFDGKWVMTQDISDNN